jgi:hypothetical protein
VEAASMVLTNSFVNVLLAGVDQLVPLILMNVIVFLVKMVDNVTMDVIVTFVIVVPVLRV